MPILGIDLGTTNSACALWQDDKPVLVPNRFNRFLTPSVVGVDDGGELLVGESANARLVSHPDKTLAVFKRFMGTEQTFALGKQLYSAPELSALILRSLKDDAETLLGEPINEAVISVPAYFNDVQRKATRLAGELAGFKVERLINEPTAAAMVYGLQKRDDGARYLILDLGGGTFDVTLVEYFAGVLEVHASAGDNFLGGEDFLQALVDVYCQAQKLDKQNLPKDQQQKLKEALTQALHALSSQHQAVVQPVLSANHEPWQIDRSQFEKIAAPLLSRVQLPVERALMDSGIAIGDIDEIVLVGGATRMPVFRSLVAKMFRRLPSAQVDPDTVVALGAGIQAGLREQSQALDDVVLTDVCPYSLGVGIHNEADRDGRQGLIFMPIIERNTIVPVSIERSLVTVADNQTQLRIGIYQGESRLVKNNVFLGELEVAVPAAAAGKEQVSVRYSYDMNGILEVDVTVLSTGATHQKLIINSSQELSAKELEAARGKLAGLKFHPREAELNRALLARAERLFAGALGPRREVISSITSAFEQALESQNPKVIERAAREFEQQLQALELGSPLA